MVIEQLRSVHPSIVNSTCITRQHCHNHYHHSIGNNTCIDRQHSHYYYHYSITYSTCVNRQHWALLYMVEHKTKLQMTIN